MRACVCVVMCLVALCAADTETTKTLSEKTADIPAWYVQRVILKPQERGVDDELSPKTHDTTLCQRRSLKVSFDFISWNVSVVAPREYDAGYCYGDCPTAMLLRLNGTQHTLIQSLAREMYLHRAESVLRSYRVLACFYGIYG